MAPKDVLSAALALPPDERLALASELLASVEQPWTDEWERAWAAELDRRAEDLESGRVKGIPWEEVRERLRASLERR